MTNTNSLRIKLTLIAFSIALTAATAFAQTDAQKAFAAIRSMPGTWEGKTLEGADVQVSFKVVSGGSAVVSEIVGKDDMISMIHLDGPDKLMLTHYCAVGNQPRMLGSLSPDGKNRHLQVSGCHQSLEPRRRSHGSHGAHVARRQSSHRGVGLR